jgi:phosphatidylglycerol:prolipoprotein diacylglycerol transferase
MNAPDIVFPNLGIEITNINPVAFSIFGIPIYWYAILICTGILGGLGMASIVAKKTKQNPDIYSEFLIYALFAAIFGARLFYVVFSFEDYKDNLIEVFNIRQGGLAIYGGVIAAVIAAIVFTKVKKLNFWVLVDTSVSGLLVGQIIGRWGNFVNREAFGGFTDSLFTMGIKVSEAKYVPTQVLDKLVMINGESYMQVHPTFFYESAWNLMVLIVILIYYKHKKFDGEIFFIYLAGYGLGRAWIEQLRTDQLLLGNTNIPISQALAIIFVIISIVYIVYKRASIKKNNKLGINNSD